MHLVDYLYCLSCLMRLHADFSLYIFCCCIGAAALCRRERFGWQTAYADVCNMHPTLQANFRPKHCYRPLLPFKLKSEARSGKSAWLMRRSRRSGLWRVSAEPPEWRSRLCCSKLRQFKMLRVNAKVNSRGYSLDRSLRLPIGVAHGSQVDRESYLLATALALRQLLRCDFGALARRVEACRPCHTCKATDRALQVKQLVTVTLQACALTHVNICM